ncbi:MAG: PIN domain-containing protein [Planctomycetes bacterium]|nr:PIN domain-containing protein [Planctomycetota bacterium]
MKVVFDTNILVSALLTPGGDCDQLMRLMGRGVIQACLDPRLMAEYEDVLPREGLGIPALLRNRLLDELRAFSERVAAPPLAVSLPHEDDRPFLEVAHAAGAKLVTGNLRHYPKRSRAGVPVLTPAELLDLLREGA